MHRPLWSDPKDLPPSPLGGAQRHESHWGRCLASMADVEDTRNTELGLLQQLNGQQVPSIVMLQRNTCTENSALFGLDCRTHMILYEICIRCTFHSVPPGHVVLQDYPSFIPKESQHNLSRSA